SENANDTWARASTSPNRRDRSINSSTSRRIGDVPPEAARSRGSGGVDRGDAFGGRDAQGDGQRVRDVLGDVERHLLAHLLGHVVEVSLVPLRKDDLLEARAVGGEDLLLHAPARPPPPLQGH